MMDSGKWKDAYLSLRPFSPLLFEDGSEILKALGKASIEEESLVYVEVNEGLL